MYLVVFVFIVCVFIFTPYFLLLNSGLGAARQESPPPHSRSSTHAAAVSLAVEPVIFTVFSSNS